VGYDHPVVPIIPHEVGHLQGLWHPTNRDAFDPAIGPHKAGTCGELAPPSESFWEWYHDFGGSTGAAIGPSDESDVDGEVFGFDIRLPGGAGDVVDWQVVPELMAYLPKPPVCPYTAPADSGVQWLSIRNWNRVITNVAPASVGPVSALAGPGSAGTILVGGSVPDAGPVQFAAVKRLPKQVSLPGGDHTVAVTYASGAVHEASVAVEAPEPASADEVAAPRTRWFMTAVPNNGRITRIALLDAHGAELGRVDASPTDPTIAITGPAAFSQHTGLFSLDWTISDPDGPGLRHLVQFSPDNGSSWRTLALNATGTQMTLDAAKLPASSTGILRVAVTDGINTAVSEVVGISIPNHAPTLTLLEPRAGQTFLGSQTVNFRARPSDVDGHPVIVRWFSNRHGSLGSGASFDRLAHTLATGTHVIEASPVDLLGRAGVSVKTTINIQRLAPPNAPPEIVSVAVGEATAGTPTALTASVADDVPGPLVVDVDWGDGARDVATTSGPSGTVSASHTWGAPGTYNVVVRVTDARGAVATSQTSVVVTGGSPPALGAIAISRPCGAPPGTPVGVNVQVDNATDAAVTFEWGDGTRTERVVTAGAAAAQHTYAKPGAYKLRIRAANAAGEALATRTIPIRGVAIGNSTAVVVGTTGNDHLAVVSTPLLVTMISDIPGATLVVVARKLDRIDFYSCGGRDSLTAVGATRIITH
jgi:hypothetical protein